MKNLLIQDWFWCFFASGIFYISLGNAVKNFKGSSAIFLMLMNAVFGIGTLLNLVLLVYVGVVMVWWYPFVMVVSACLSGIFSGGFDLLSNGWSGIISLIAYPILLISTWVMLLNA